MHEDPPPINETLPRWPGVNVLRGLSVVLVVLHHVHLRFKLRGFPVNELVPKPLARVLFWSGQPAVIVFFVISGFLITQRTLARWGRLERVQVTAFYRMRAARILPCLLLLLAVLASLHGLGASDYVIPLERASLTRALVAALGFHVNWLEGTRGYLPGAWDVLWSLSVEEAFYLAFPLVCLAARSERGVTLVLALLLVIGPVTRVQIDGQVPWEDYAYLATADVQQQPRPPEVPRGGFAPHLPESGHRAARGWHRFVPPRSGCEVTNVWRPHTGGRHARYGKCSR